MTICLCSVIPYDTTGGASTFNRHFINLFRKQGQSILFLTIGNAADAALADAVSRPDAHYTKVVLNKSYYSLFHNFKKYFRPGGSNAPRFLAAGYAMRQWLVTHHKKYGIGIIEVSDGGGLGTFLADAALPPVVLGGHGSNLQISRYDHTAFDEQGALLKMMELQSYRYCDSIITHSLMNRKDLQQFTSRPVVICRIPFEPEVFFPREELGTPLVAGSLRFLKGPVLLAESLNILLQKKKPVKMAWIGEDSGSVKGHDSAARYLQQEYGRVWNHLLYWKGAMTPGELLKEMASAKFVVVPSVWETFSYAALEAASFGKAILITRGAGASELFTDGVDAIVVDPDKSSLAAGILRLDEDHLLRTRLGTNAQDMVARNFRSEEIVKERLTIYGQIISNRDPQKPPLEQRIACIHPYLTPQRKIYYTARRKVKKMYQLLLGKKDQLP